MSRTKLNYDKQVAKALDLRVEEEKSLNSDTVENDRTVPLHRERSASLKCV
jgi:hypothetical protein